MASTWTDARIDLLKALWADGVPASMIASRLGEVTRNGVIGKIHRLGLAGRKSPSFPPAARRSTPRNPTAFYATPKPPKRAKINRFAKNPVVDKCIAEPLGGVSFADLEETMCHWPVGDPMEEGFHFCGRRKTSRIPYCEHHANIAYNQTAKTGAQTVPCYRPDRVAA